MKNPKWREAYPQGHKVKYGGKFLTTWSGYSLDLIQTNGGTISANKNRGYEDDQVNFSYTANKDCYFNGWSANTGSFNGNTYTFSNGNASAKGSFINTSPAKLFNYTSQNIKMVGTTCYTGIAVQNYMFLDGPYYDSISPKFLSQNSATIKTKNYFVVKYDMMRDCGFGQYSWTSTGTNEGILMHAWQKSSPSFNMAFVPELEVSLGRGGGLDRAYTNYSFGSTYEPLYNEDGASTATGITTNDIPSSTQSFTAYAKPLKPYAKHFNHGRLGTYTNTFSGYWVGKYTLHVNASGKWNYNGYCFEPSAYEDLTWKPIKYVFDMNTFAYSSYVGDECVYKQTNTKTWEKPQDGASAVPAKLFAIHRVNPFITGSWHTDWNGTSSTNRIAGSAIARNVSITYFDTCEQANMWAQHN